MFTSLLSPLLDGRLPSAIGIEHVLKEKLAVYSIFKLRPNILFQDSIFTAILDPIRSLYFFKMKPSHRQFVLILIRKK